MKSKGQAGEMRLIFEIGQEVIGNELEEHALHLVESTSSDLISSPSFDALNNKIANVKSPTELYNHITVKLLEYDIKQGSGAFGVGSLSVQSQAILNELAAKLRIHKLQREILWFNSCVNRFITVSEGSVPVPIETIVLIYENLYPLLLQSKNGCQFIKSIQTTDTKLEIVVDPPCFLSTVVDMQMHDVCVQSLYQILMDHVNRYKDVFAKAEHSSSLKQTLSLLKSLHEYQSNEKSFTEIIKDLLKCGTLNRLSNVVEFAIPMVKNDFSKRLFHTCALIMDELDSDLKYADVYSVYAKNFMTIVVEIYMKHIILEIQDFVYAISPSAKQSLTAVNAKPTLVTNSIFDLYFITADIKNKFGKFIEDPVLGEEFTVHTWFSICIHNWLIQSEQKLIDWTMNAINLDKFLSISTGDNMLHSNSVVDLFFCVRQILECLKKLEWNKSNSNDYSREAQEKRHQWGLFISRFSLILSHVVTKYAETVSEQVTSSHEQRLKAKKKNNSKLAKLMADFKLGNDTSMKKTKNSELSKSLNNVNLVQNQDSDDWLADGEFVKSTCVKINNLESAREQVTELYDSLDIDGLMSDWGNQSRLGNSLAENHVASVAAAGITGYLSLNIVSAENLMPADGSGYSDPYCMINVLSRHLTAINDTESKSSPSKTSINSLKLQEWTVINPFQNSQAHNAENEIKQVAKSKIIRRNLNPRWNESFSVVLRNAIQIEVKILDHDLISKDRQIGTATLDLACSQTSPSSSKSNVNLSQSVFAAQNDGDDKMETHDIWVNLSPQGRILLRMEFRSNINLANQQLADPQFYMRKTLRELKRQSNDLLDLIVTGMSERIARDLARIVRDAESPTKKRKKNLFSFSKKNNEAECFDGEDCGEAQINMAIMMAEVEMEQIEQAMQPITTYLNDYLAALSTQLYPRLFKTLMKNLWKTIVVTVQDLCVPSLYGHSLAIMRLEGRHEPLSRRQVNMISACVQVLREFMYADGSDHGLSYQQLVTANQDHQILETVLNNYCKSTESLKHEIEKELTMKVNDAAETSETIHLKQANVDAILRILRLRLGTKNEYIRQQLLTREERNL